VLALGGVSLGRLQKYHLLIFLESTALLLCTPLLVRPSAYRQTVESLRWMRMFHVAT